jgi:hypothetical protein
MAARSLRKDAQGHVVETAGAQCAPLHMPHKVITLQFDYNPTIRAVFLRKKGTE